jgi:thymidylate kinase
MVENKFVRINPTKNIQEYPCSEKVILCDRFHLGEAVYAPIYRGYTLDYMEHLESLMSRPTILILMNPINTDVIYERHKKENEAFLQEEDIETALALFRDAFDKSTIPIKIEISSDSMEVTELAVEAIIGYIFNINNIPTSINISEFGVNEKFKTE